jgi:tetratricopeptide (TPR) repeat protein
LSLALASDVPDAPAARAKALDGAGVLALAHGDIAAGRRYIEAFQEEAGNLRDLVSIARATFCRGILAGHERRLDDARDAFSSALLLYHELGDRRWTTAALNNLGSVAAMTGEVEEAVHYYLQSLEMAREAGDTPSILMALQNLGWQDVIRGRLDEATMRYEECMTIVRTLDDRWRYAGMLIGPAVIALERGDLVEARRVLTESLSIHHELGDEIQVATMIEWLGRVVIAEGDPVRAARWFRVTAAVRDRLGSTFDHFETSVAERYVQMGIAQVGEAAWSEAWSSGTSMTLEDAYQEALVRNP